MHAVVIYYSVIVVDLWISSSQIPPMLPWASVYNY